MTCSRVFVRVSSRANQVSEGLSAVEEAIERSEHTEERWLIAESLRMKDELLLSQGVKGVPAARGEDHFRQALDSSRCTTGLPRVRHDRPQNGKSVSRRVRKADRPAGKPGLNSALNQTDVTGQRSSLAMMASAAWVHTKGLGLVLCSAR